MKEFYRANKWFKLRATILKFPHHGGALRKASSDWDANTLISNVDPQFIIVSVGKSNRYKHHSKEFLQAGSHLPTIRLVSNKIHAENTMTPKEDKPT